jgi:Lon protease-like protein
MGAKGCCIRVSNIKENEKQIYLMFCQGSCRIVVKEEGQMALELLKCGLLVTTVTWISLSVSSPQGLCVLKTMLLKSSALLSAPVGIWIHPGQQL